MTAVIEYAAEEARRAPDQTRQAMAEDHQQAVEAGNGVDRFLGVPESSISDAGDALTRRIAELAQRFVTTVSSSSRSCRSSR